jgi:uncharacterized protein related to proFAR isomerase
LLSIPTLYIRQKQAFKKEDSIMRLLGNPVEVAKKLKEKDYKLLHIVDMDALDGLSTNLDIYSAMTYFINVQVECAPVDSLVKSLLSLRCRVVLPASSGLVLSGIREKNLLVAKVKSDSEEPVDDFHDVLIEDADDEAVKRYTGLGKRVIVYERDNVKEIVWGTIISIS